MSGDDFGNNPDGFGNPDDGFGQGTGGGSAATTTPAITGAALYIEPKAKPQIRRYVYPWWEDAAEEEARKIAAAAPKLPGEIAPGVPAEAAVVRQAPAEAVSAIGDDPQSIADEQAANEAAEVLIASVRATIVTHSVPQPAAETAVVSALMLPDDLFFAPIAAPADIVDDALVMEAIAIIETIELQECC